MFFGKKGLLQTGIFSHPRNGNVLRLVGFRVSGVEMQTKGPRGSETCSSVPASTILSRRPQRNHNLSTLTRLQLKPQDLQNLQGSTF